MLLSPGNSDPGRLDRRCTLSYPLETRDALGGVEVEWIAAATVWAEKVPAAGGRLYAAEAKRYEQSLVYRIRHRTDVAPGWRLTHGDDTFEITSVEELGRGQWLALALRGIDQTTGSSGTGAGSDAEVLHDGEAVVLHDGSPQILHAA